MSRKKNEHFSGYFNIPELMIDCVNHSKCAWGDTFNGAVYITKVIYNDPATIVFWSDGSKTTAKCSGTDVYNPQVGLLLATLKKFGKVSQILDDWSPTSENYPNHIEVKDVRARHK